MLLLTASCSAPQAKLGSSDAGSHPGDAGSADAGQCQSKYDCPSDRICIAGQCGPTSPDGTCTAVDQCTAGFVCSTQHECVAGCVDARDCVAPAVCNFVRGQCEVPDSGMSVTVDAGTVPDAGTEDAGAPPDAGTEPDAGVIDAGTVPDAGTVDAGTVPDAGTIDAGMAPDAGVIDAGPSLDAGMDAGQLGPCAVNNGGCDPHATCTDVSGTVNCACNYGYDGNGIQCLPEDIGAACSSFRPGTCMNGEMCVSAGAISTCTLDCGSNSDCGNNGPDSNICVYVDPLNQSLCAAGCDSSQGGACRTGFVCASVTDSNGDPANACVPDCRLTGGMCFNGGVCNQGNGTCATQMPQTYDSCDPNNSNCPDGDDCVQVSQGRFQSGGYVCLQQCQSDSDCSSGASCVVQGDQTMYCDVTCTPWSQNPPCPGTLRCDVQDSNGNWLCGP